MMDMVMEASMSPRTKARMDNLVCCNLSGLPAGGLFRDKVIEIIVRSVKTKLRNLHMSLNDQILDKSISSLSIISKIVDHDSRSMCAGNLGLQSSYDYVGDESKKYMTEKIKELDPFDPNRPKVTLLDKSKGQSPFTGMNKERIEQFAKRNKKNYKRNHPNKVVLTSLDMFRKQSETDRNDDMELEGADIPDQLSYCDREGVHVGGHLQHEGEHAQQAEGYDQHGGGYVQQVGNTTFNMLEDICES